MRAKPVNADRIAEEKKSFAERDWEFTAAVVVNIG
jgi:hypothetical protein